MRIQLGVKIWSTNVTLIAEADKLFAQGRLDYVELFCVPRSFEETASRWSDAHVPFVIHAPHSMAGLNFSIRDMEKKNAVLAEESFRMADALHADVVIFHPGIGGTIEETLRQASRFRDPRLVMENKPYEAIDGQKCIGARPSELAELLRCLDAGFCLDFGHAIEAANAIREEPMAFIGQFLQLKPIMFHLTDGDYGGKVDRHDRYGKGNFPLGTLLSFVPDGSRVTDEAERNNYVTLDEFVQDQSLVEQMLGV